ncbi:trafficking protein particle complex subunit 6A isoform X11 [Equus asinus]|uniref:trafficking protein particle complex subunit 6A isoform X11 n=1 Tax=Equus asinus TaxID=9793 RepID=UPI0038F5D99C
MIPTPAPGFTESSGTLESRPPLAQHPLPVLLGAEPCVCGRSAGPPPPRSCLPPRALHLPPLCLPTQGQNMSLSVLEGMGFRVGQALGERNPAWLPPSSSPWAPQAWPGDPPASAWPKCLPLPPRLSRETLAYREELDILKFLCKDLWMAVFQKQMDSLRTNHQGTYVLQDNSFPLLIRMASGLQYLEEAPKFLAFTCGLLRGTLCTLGVKSLVTASVAALPACKFQVVIQKS